MCTTIPSSRIWGSFPPFRLLGLKAIISQEMYTVLKARAELLFCSLDLLFCHVLVAIAVMVCWRSPVDKDA